MGNSFGRLFRITTFGESHGGGVGVVIDGCPPRIPISIEDIQRDLDRRRPGQSKITTQRKESDRVEILSGIHESGVSLGTPIAMLVRNEDARSADYEEMREKYRPSHADFTYDQKYGIRAWQGGGRSSARETIGRVAAGAVAKSVLKTKYKVEVLAYVERVQDIEFDGDPLEVHSADVKANPVRCPDPATAEQMIALIEAVRKEGNSVGGTIVGVAKGVPAGWGEPVFDRLEADLAKAMLSLPACKAFEIGSGFAGTRSTGLEHNDAFRSGGPVGAFTTTNRSGGVQGGISNGMPILIRAGFKPTATVMREQDTVDVRLENTTLAGRGRHDPCVLPRAVPIVEAMMALVLVDHALRQESNL
jgi:chorismate synthase